jgi:hypothetical protein
LTGCEKVVDPGNVQRLWVATSSAQDGWAVNYPKQRKILAMAGRLWLFYSDGVDALVRSTADGATLSDAQRVREAMVFGHRCGYAFDGTWLHYACSTALQGEGVYYRRAVPHSDGTLEWTGPEQLVFDVGPGTAMYPKVLVDAAGRPWVGFMLFPSGFMTPPQEAVVTRAAASDGTWTTDVGFPYVLVAGSTETYPDPLGVALEGGGVYWVCDPDGEAQYIGRLWRDGVWADEETVTESAQKYALFDLVAAGDVVHLAYGGGTLKYRRRDASGTWSGERTIASGASGHVTIARSADGAVISWLDLGGNRILSRAVTSDSLGPTLLILDASSAGGLAGADLGINLNGISEPDPRFGMAVTTTTGQQAPFGIWLATWPQ